MLTSSMERIAVRMCTNFMVFSLVGGVASGRSPSGYDARTSADFQKILAVRGTYLSPTGAGCAIRAA